MRLRSGCRGWWIAAAALAADRISKVFAAAGRDGGAHSALRGLLSWDYTQNRGMAFSLLSGRSALLIALTLVLVIGVVVYLMKTPAAPRLARVGLWLVAGGGLGNLWDRLAYGYVIDFIRLDFIHFAIFNVADICVCTGAVLVALAVFFGQGRAHER